MDNRGYIYFLLNQAMPGLVKIGFTAHPVDSRMRQLNTSGVPKPFELAAWFAVSSAKDCELEVHKTLSNKRISREREFFKVDLKEALDLSLPVIKKFLIECANSSHMSLSEKVPDQAVAVDKDEVYFMSFILHDSHDRKGPLSTEELAKHHLKYHPLELEHKLIKLSEKGLIERVKNRTSVEGWWRMTPEGVKFMFENGHVLQEVIDDQKRDARQKTSADS